MKLYLGSREYRPDGYLTVDIDAGRGPDIVADVTDLNSIADDSVEVICASHVLEHMAWPTAYRALSEWARVLRPGGTMRVAVPDLSVLAAMIVEGQNTWGATGLMFGLGRLDSPLEAHQFGYTRGMLVGLLRTLGMGRFDWWKHDIPDASNAWMPDGADGRMAVSLNIAATKLGAPAIPPATVLAALLRDRAAPFDRVYAACLDAHPAAAPTDDDPRLTQRLHMALIEARMRIKYLEEQLQRP